MKTIPLPDLTAQRGGDEHPCCTGEQACGKERRSHRAGYLAGLIERVFPRLDPPGTAAPSRRRSRNAFFSGLD